MKLKFIAIIASSFVLASCAQVQEGLQTTMTKLGNDFKKAVTPGQSTGSAQRSGGKRGSLTVDECKASKGKSKQQMENLVGLKLNESNSSGYTSISEMYNLEIRGVKTRYGTDFGVCSIQIDPDTNRVVTYSIVL